MSVILVVYDHTTSLRLLSFILQQENYVVLTARNGLQAIECLERMHVDLVLIDLLMPEMDGLVLLEALRADERYRTLPVIALTGSRREKDYRRAQAAGVTAILTTPIESHELLDEVKRLVRPKERSIQRGYNFFIPQFATGTSGLQLYLPFVPLFPMTPAPNNEPSRNRSEVPTSAPVHIESADKATVSVQGETVDTKNTHPQEELGSLKTRYPGSQVFLLLAVARALIEDNETVFVNKPYTIQAGVSWRELEGFVSEPAEVAVAQPDESIPIDLLFHEDEQIELLSDWQQTILYQPDQHDTQLVDFRFRALSAAHISISIDFYHKQRWLRTIKFEFDSIDTP